MKTSELMTEIARQLKREFVSVLLDPAIEEGGLSGWVVGPNGEAEVINARRLGDKSCIHRHYRRRRDRGGSYVPVHLPIFG